MSEILVHLGGVSAALLLVVIMSLFKSLLWQFPTNLHRSLRLDVSEWLNAVLIGTLVTQLTLMIDYVFALSLHAILPSLSTLLLQLTSWMTQRQPLPPKRLRAGLT